MRRPKNAEFYEEVETEQAELKDAMTEKMLPLPAEDSFSEFCRKVGLDNICDPPTYGTYGRDWNHYNLDELDKMIVRRSLDGLALRLCCSQYPRYASTFGTIGIPTFSTDLGQAVLEEVRYRYGVKMEVRFTPPNGEPGEWMELAVFERMNPMLIGVSRYSEDHKVFSFYSFDLVLPDEAKLAEGPPKLTIRQRISRWLFGI